MSLAQEEAFDLLQTQYGTQKNSGMAKCLEKPLRCAQNQNTAVQADLKYPLNK